MKINHLHNFLETYFSAYQCEIVHNETGVLTIQLNEEMDKVLMNRPFYWHYMKSSGNVGEPAQLTLITNPDQREQKGEWIHFGSPRLQQIFNHLKITSKNIKLFQKVDTQRNTALYPWLFVNFKISYEGKHNKDELFSIGLNLMNGMMRTKMMELLQKIPFSLTISDLCYPISPLIKINSGYMRIIAVIEDYLKNQPHDWANESITTLTEEIQMVQHFYENNPDDPQLSKEIDDLTKRYTPSITYRVVNGGVVYVAEDMFKQ